MKKNEKIDHRQRHQKKKKKKKSSASEDDDEILSGNEEGKSSRTFAGKALTIVIGKPRNNDLTPTFLTRSRPVPKNPILAASGEICRTVLMVSAP